MNGEAIVRIPIKDLAAVLDLEPGITVGMAWLMPAETSGLLLCLRLEGPSLPPAGPGFSAPVVIDLPRRKGGTHHGQTE